MQTVITGATGFIGRHLVELLKTEGHSITTVTRDAAKAQTVFGPSIACLAWNDEKARIKAIAEADAVFHLAGASVAEKRWNTEYKREIRDSRVSTTRTIVEARPRLLVCASAVGYYGSHGDTVLNEDSTPGDDFLADVCRLWEEEASKAEVYGARVARVRIGQVLGRGGGALEAMLNPPGVPFSPWKLGAGGPLGDGKQWMPWVHLDDVAALFLWCAQNPQATGAVNATSPNPVTNRTFSDILGRVLHRPALLPAPAFALRALLGEFAESILASQRVLPVRTQKLGFSFKFTDLETALRNLL